MKIHPLTLTVSGLLLSGAVAANSADDNEMERVVVTASPLERTALESAQPIYVLSGDLLRQSQAATLGETLRELPGVQATYYSPTSSSPVIRGLEGPRVRILQNGLDVGDVSRGGPDHAVTTETLTAQQIEVLRGPATLLYGSGASGGIVNVVDNRIPRQPVYNLQGEASTGISSVANERHISAALQQGNENVALHVDAFKRDADDYAVPAFITPDGEQATTIENSFTDDLGGTIGASYFFNNGFAGISYARLEREYGIPGHAHEHTDEESVDHEHDHDHDHEGSEHIFADMTQDRWQLLSQFDQPFSGFERVNLNLAYTETNHEEIEGGYVESAFRAQQTELRLIGRHQPVAGWRGALGVQLRLEEYDAYGSEAFTPPSETQLAGIFWLGERVMGNVTWELGARAEQVEVESHGIRSLNYVPLSTSVGATWRYTPRLQLSASLSYSERAPQANELFSNGAHFATRTYEVGGIYDVHEEHHHDDHEHEHEHEHEEYHLAYANQTLDKEASHNIDLGLHYEGEQWHLDANVFFNRIKDFVFAHNLGFTSAHLDSEIGHEHEETHEHEHDHAHDSDGLTVYRYMQQDADLYGYEVSGQYIFNSHWSLNAFSDYTRAKFSGSYGNVPRIPAQRAGLSLTYAQNNWDTTLGYTQYWAQNDTAENEASTEAFGLVNAYLNYYPSLSGGQDLAFYLRAENLSNRLGYAHNSFIRDYAPLPGRNIGVGVRLTF